MKKLINLLNDRIKLKKFYKILCLILAINILSSNMTGVFLKSRASDVQTQESENFLENKKEFKTDDEILTIENDRFLHNEEFLVENLESEKEDRLLGKIYEEFKLDINKIFTSLSYALYKNIGIKKESISGKSSVNIYFDNYFTKIDKDSEIYIVAFDKDEKLIDLIKDSNTKINYKDGSQTVIESIDLKIEDPREIFILEYEKEKPIEKNKKENKEEIPEEDKKEEKIEEKNENIEINNSQTKLSEENKSDTINTNPQEKEVVKEEVKIETKKTKEVQTEKESEDKKEETEKIELKEEKAKIETKEQNKESPKEAIEKQNIGPSNIRSTEIKPLMVTRQGSWNNDFTSNVRKVDVLTRQNQEWVSAGSVYDKDQVKVNIEYAIPVGFVSNENPIMTYQVPKAIKLEKELSGTVKTLSGEDAGTYRISQNGLITITFDSGFLNRHKDINGKVRGLDGTVQFLGTVSKDNSETRDKITFPGSGTTVEILVPKEKTTDIKSKKTGKLSEDKRKITYKIEVSTTKGTNGPVRVIDRIDYVEPRNLGYSFDLNSIKVVDSYNKVIYENKTDYTTDKKINLTEVIDRKGFDLQNLPQLQAGYRYTITYDVNLDQAPQGTSEIKVNNGAWTSSGPDQHTSDDKVKWSKSVKKSGIFNPNGEGYGEVNWFIDVNPDRKNLQNWTIRDIINHEIVGKVILRNMDNQQIVDITEGNGLTRSGSGWYLNYSFNKAEIQQIDQDFNDRYRLEYATKVTQGVQSVSNTVYKEGGDNEQDTATVDTTHKLTLSKHSNGTFLDDVNNRTKNKWEVGVNVESSQSTSFTFTDTFENLKKSPGGEDLGNESHYAYASELEKELKKELFFTNYDGESYLYNGNGQTPQHRGNQNNQGVTSISVTYYDINDRVVKSTDSNSKVKKFTVNIEYQSFFNPKYFSISEYHTYGDLSQVKNGEKAKIINKAAVADKETTAETYYEKRGKLEKGVYTGTKNGIPIYKNGKSTVDYSKDKGQIEYRLMLKTSEADGKSRETKGTLIIKDYLPDGAKYVEASLQAAFYNPRDPYYPKHTTSNGWGTDFNNASKPSIKMDTVEGKKVATITIPNYIYSPHSPIVQIFYKLDINDDPYWKDHKVGDKTYINNVEWKSEKTSNEVKVEKKLDKLTKKGWQLDDKGNPVQIDDHDKPVGNPTGKIKYNLVINPTGEDLLPNSDELTLTDTLNAQGKVPKFDVDNAKLYEYDESKQDNKGKEIEKSRYKITFDEKTLKLTLKLPDKLACVFEYVYEFTNLADYFQVRNDAELSGIAKSSDSITLRDNDSSATVTVKEIKIYKVDSKDIKKFLPGTKFKLEKFNKDKWDDLPHAWDRVNYKGSSEITIPESGLIEWSLSGLNPGLEANMLYRLTETESLDGYTKLKEPIYFIWMKAVLDEHDSYNSSGAYLSQIDKSKIHFFKNSGGIMYIKNEYTKLRVNKFWQDIDGNEFQNENIPDIRVTVDLYRKTGANGTFEKLENQSKTLTKANKYTASWENLVQTDNSGQEYFYKVVEQKVEGYETSYFNNEGIGSGEINIFNKKIKTNDVELPSTGGQGTNGIYLLAMALLVFVAIYFSKEASKKLLRNKN